MVYCTLWFGYIVRYFKCAGMKAKKLRWRYKSTEEDQRHEDGFIHIGMNKFGYSTLCGLGDEGFQSGYRLNRNELISTNKKIDCYACIEIYNFCKSIEL